VVPEAVFALAEREVRGGHRPGGLRRPGVEHRSRVFQREVGLGDGLDVVRDAQPGLRLRETASCTR
jgi:hypothetical protein